MPAPAIAAGTCAARASRRCVRPNSLGHGADRAGQAEAAEDLGADATSARSAGRSAACCRSAAACCRSATSRHGADGRGYAAQRICAWRTQRAVPVPPGGPASRASAPRRPGRRGRYRCRPSQSQWLRLHRRHAVVGLAAARARRACRAGSSRHRAHRRRSSSAKAASARPATATSPLPRRRRDARPPAGVGAAGRL